MTGKSMPRGKRNIDMAKQTKRRFFLPLLGLIAAQFVFLSPPATDTSFSLTLDRLMETNHSDHRIASGKTFRSYDRGIDFSKFNSDPSHRAASSSSPSCVFRNHRNGDGTWSSFIAPPAYVALEKSQGGIHGQLRDRSVSHEGIWKSFIGEDHRPIPIASDEARTTPSLRGTVGMPPTPLVFLIQFLARSTLPDKIVYFLFVLCYSLCLFNWLLKNHPDI
jgi:hypothetical protein